MARGYSDYGNAVAVMSDPRKDTMGDKAYYQMTVQEALDDLGT